MKKGMSIVVLFAVFFISTLSAHATLELRGTDSLGYRLIYDTDLNITWYDYSTPIIENWQSQMDWASGLSVSGGDLVGVYDDWRLPSTVDGPYVWGYDGTTTVGYNITSSEMGHLYYTELGNKGYYDTSGNPTGCDYESCLTQTGDFQNLQTGAYWSSTEYAADPHYAWIFSSGYGSQNPDGKTPFFTSVNIVAIAVRPGDVAVVPEPISSILFVTGGGLLAGRLYLKHRTK